MIHIFSCVIALIFYTIINTFCIFTKITMNLKSNHSCFIDIIADIAASNSVNPCLDTITLSFYFVVIPFTLDKCLTR